MFFLTAEKETVINGQTKVVGIFGDPVSHSLSPAMHNAAFKEKGLNFCYLPFRVKKGDLPAAIRAITSLGLRGVNITAPHKEAAVPYLEELSPEARLLKAVNTIENREGKLLGYNTDVDGFCFLLENNFKNVKFSREKVCLLGAGGAARAVSLALARAGVGALLMANRTVARAGSLASLLSAGGIFKDSCINVIKTERNSLRENMKGSIVLINALSEDPVALGFLPEGRLPGCKAAIDLRYSPLQTTPFREWAARHGILFVSGLDMLLGQGLKAFEIFTGTKAPLTAMKEALQKSLTIY